jgi:hypothetical protein
MCPVLLRSEFHPIDSFAAQLIGYHPSRNPVRAAYTASLESQISSLRDELATVYKTQGQNAQRLLAMNETLREKEEALRMESESVRAANDDLIALRKKVEHHSEMMFEKDRTAQVKAAHCWITMTFSCCDIDSYRRDQHPPT